MSAPSNERHYEVISPYRANIHMGYGEPPESGCEWVMVEAHSKREALIKAIKTPEFKSWVAEMRGDKQPPFKGLEVRLTVCEHGTCWGCQECAECEAESYAAMLREDAHEFIAQPGCNICICGEPIGATVHNRTDLTQIDGSGAAS